MSNWGRQGLAMGATAALLFAGGIAGVAYGQAAPEGRSAATESYEGPPLSQAGATGGGDAMLMDTMMTAPVATQAAPQSAPAAQTTPAQGATSTTQPAPRKIQMVQARAELDKTIDAKKAKQGDPVTAKLLAEVKIPDAQPLPKNTVLEGHVDQVTPSEHKSDSTVVVTFDKAKLKDGQELPIKATILAMAEPAMMSPDAGGGGGGAPAGGAMPAGGGGGGAAGVAGGGVARGASGGGSEASAPAPQQAPSMQDSGGGSQQQPMSKVPDVKLTSDIHQHNSATLTSKGRNVHVPDGTEMELAIAVIPAGVKLQ